MIARSEPIGGAAIADAGVRVLPTEWAGPALPLPGRKPKRRGQHFIARR